MKISVLVAAFLISVMVSGGISAQDGEMPAIGQIAYIDAGFNVHVMDLESGIDTLLTDDSGISADTALVYQMPTWSNDGRLAYFQTRLSSDGGFVTQIFVSPDGELPGENRYTGESESFTYAYWSPVNCAEGENCRDLAVLLGSGTAGEFIVELVRHGSDAPSSVQAGTGAPFYFSWSPEGSQMLWQRNNSRLDIYGVTEREIVQALDQRPGAFFAPAWSPIDNRLAFGELNSTRTTDLIVFNDDTTTRLAQNITGLVSFAWSPDATQMAYVSPREPLRTVSSTTGEELSRTPDTGILAFFWSPDGTKIAYLTLEVPPGSFSAKRQALAPTAMPVLQEGTPARVVWSIFDVNTGEIQQFSPFTPTRDMVYLLTYYDQFSQSHRLWSPDSRYLVYSEVASGGNAVIHAIDTLNNFGAPIFIADGTIGIWSYN